MRRIKRPARKANGRERQVQLKLVWSVAWSFHRTTGIDVDDLFSEACVAYLQAVQKYNKNLGVKKTTFLYHVMARHLNVFIKKELRIRCASRGSSEVLPELICTITPFDIAAFNDEVAHLSSNAQTICQWIFSAPAEYCSLTAKGARGCLRNELREAGWTWPQIWATFRELKEFAKQ